MKVMGRQFWLGPMPVFFLVSVIKKALLPLFGSNAFSLVVTFKTLLYFDTLVFERDVQHFHIVNILLLG